MEFLLPLRDALSKEPSLGGPPVVAAKDTRTQPYKVGIVGAGAAGLFTAMIFDHLKSILPDFKVEYEILEAHREERVGGRLYTHYFKHGGPSYPTGKHDYFDVGAMRFPESGIMKRVFELFELLHMYKHDGSRAPVKGELVPYVFRHEKQPTLYNGVRRVLGSRGIKAADFKINGIPDKTAGELVSAAIEPFLREHQRGFKEFWEKILKDAEPYSVRQYFTEHCKYDFKTIQFLETVAYGDGWYNQGFTDHILEAIIFTPGPKWWCIEGGSQELAHNMRKKLEHPERVSFSQRVVEMAYTSDKQKIRVGVNGETAPRQYDAVFNSAPLGAMQRMDLEGLNLHWEVKSAIRSLGYGVSCKVGVRFRDLWWKKHFGITTGGAARTDLPIRQCVYPSYAAGDDDDEPGVLLVSYCWGQEAERIGALINNRQSPQAEAELKEVLVHDLARLHAGNDSHDEYVRVHKIIAGSYLDHFAHDWSADPYSAGAYAYYGPGQFKYMHQGITASDGKHVIIGEAASAHHAWVVGSLDSAVRGVFQFLCRHRMEDAGVEKAYTLYLDDLIRGPYGPLPAEYDSMRFRGATLDSDGKVLPPGRLAELQVQAERLRQKQGTDELKLDPESLNSLNLDALRRVLASTP
ncbi:flavin containing amine oxidoreductase, partial [Metarhizium majus ARSEF 297]